MSSTRSKKVAGLIQAEISDIIQRRLKDPRVGFVTITEVRLSDDLKNARVYVSVLGDDKQKQNSIKGLDRARTFIQNELGHRVRLRYLPVLQFHLDESLEYGANIERLIDEIHLNDRTAEK